MTIYSAKPELFAAAARFVSTEQVRPYLQGVYITPAEKGGAVMAATNGHSMFVAYDDTATWEQCAPGSAIWHPAKTKLPAAAFNSFHLRLGGGVATFMDSAMTATHVVPCREDTENTFPDWTRVLPDVEADTAPLDDQSFDSAYIADFAAVARLMTRQRRQPFVARHTGNGAALVSIADRRDCFGLLMPMRIGGAYDTGHENGLAARALVLDAMAPAPVAMAAE